jgi:hypothetical protein
VIVYTVHDLLHGEYTGIVDDFDVPGAPKSWRMEDVPDPRPKPDAGRPRSRGARFTISK